MIISLLASSQQESLTFFYFLSMLPAGALPEDLNEMWGPTYV